MKKQWLPLVFAFFLVLAPVASADDGSALDSFEQVIAQLVALIVGDESGPILPPIEEAAQPGDEPELGEIFPPWG